jgi:hypothetical protein
MGGVLWPESVMTVTSQYQPAQPLTRVFKPVACAVPMGSLTSVELPRVTFG